MIRPKKIDLPVTPLNPSEPADRRKRRELAGERPLDEQAAYLDRSHVDAAELLADINIYEGELPAGALEQPPGEAEAAAWHTLRSVIDPELGASLVDLGMIRAVQVAGHTATIELALTMPGCPLAAWLEQQVRSAVLQLPGIQDVDVRIVDSPWPNLPGSPWQHWLDEALTSNDQERSGGTLEPIAAPERSDTEASPGSVLPLRGYPGG